MTQVQIDRDTQQKLNGLADITVFCGDNGVVLGYFHPAGTRRVYDEGEIPELDDEEAQRRLSEPGGKTWEEIKRDLERLS